MKKDEDKKEQATPGSVKNLLLTDKTPDDRPVIKLINELVSLLPGVEPKSAFRNFILRTLPEENQRLRGNGGQFAGGQG